MLFSPSPSGAVFPYPVENAINDPVGASILVIPPPFPTLRVVFQLDSNGLSLQASRTKIFILSVSEVKNFIIFWTEKPLLVTSNSSSKIALVGSK